MTQLAGAQAHVDPIVNQSSGILIEGGFVSDETDYEADSTNDIEVDRTILMGTATKQLSPTMNGFFHIGLSLDVEYEPSADGSGFIFGGGVKSQIFQRDKKSVSLLGSLNYITETVELEVGQTDIEWDATIVEMVFGAAFNYQVDDSLSGYANLEIVPYSSGEVSVEGGDAEVDIERDDLMILSIGGTG